MALKFPCPKCSNQIILKVLKPGDIAQCRSCLEFVEVPTDSQYIDNPKTTITAKLTPNSPGVTEQGEYGTDSQPPPRGSCIGCGVAIRVGLSRSAHYCRSCQVNFPEFMRDGIKHIATADIAKSVFAPAGPIGPSSAFCDRNVNISELASYLHDWLLIGILGERGAGKTSILRIIQGLLQGNETLNNRYCKLQWRQRHIYVNDVLSVDQFMRNATLELVSQRPFFSKYNAEEEASLTAQLNLFGVLRAKAAIRSVDRWKDIKKAIADGLSSDVYQCFRLALRLVALSGTRTVFLIDELERFSREELHRLGNLIKACESHNASFVIAGILDSLDEVYIGHESLPRASIEYCLERFGDKEISQFFNLVNSRLQSYICFDPALAKEILRWSHGIPSIVQRMGYHILLKAITGNWYEFAEGRRKLGPVILGADNILHVKNTNQDWLTPYRRKLDNISTNDCKLQEIMESVSCQPDYLLYEPNIESIFANPAEAKNGLALLTDSYSVLRFGRKNHNNITNCPYWTFNDPVFGWFVWMLLQTTAPRPPDSRFDCSD